MTSKYKARIGMEIITTYHNQNKDKKDTE